MGIWQAISRDFGQQPIPLDRIGAATTYGYLPGWAQPTELDPLPVITTWQRTGYHANGTGR